MARFIRIRLEQLNAIRQSYRLASDYKNMQIVVFDSEVYERINNNCRQLKNWKIVNLLEEIAVIELRSMSEENQFFFSYTWEYTVDRVN